MVSAKRFRCRCFVAPIGQGPVTEGHFLTIPNRHVAAILGNRGGKDGGTIPPARLTLRKGNQTLATPPIKIRQMKQVNIYEAKTELSKLAERCRGRRGDIEQESLPRSSFQ